MREKTIESLILLVADGVNVKVRATKNMYKFTATLNQSTLTKTGNMTLFVAVKVLVVVLSPSASSDCSICKSFFRA